MKRKDWGVILIPLAVAAWLVWYKAFSNVLGPVGTWANYL